ncbi:hypothetical protein JB92DRAFT_3141531 [Gautieria morchelliformis]|nr:hypothetical protein JB92DRAFT_3141531 [Gautieria morchelliformis]
MNCTEASIIDSDLAATGVRALLYLQFTLFVLSANRSRRAILNMLWCSIPMSFGPILAALAQFVGGNLPLLDAILVSQLVWFANVGMMFARTLYDSSKQLRDALRAAAFLQFLFSMILTVIMWTFREHLPYGRCTSVRSVSMFGVDLPASGPGRFAALTFASNLLALFTLNILSRSFKTTKTPEGWIVRRRVFVEHQRHSFRVGMLLSRILIFGCFFSTTELILLRSDPSAWTFGQVLAMTLVIPAFVALLRVIVQKVAEIGSDDKDALPLSRRRVPTQSGPAIQTADSEAAGTTKSQGAAGGVVDSARYRHKPQN